MRNTSARCFEGWKRLVTLTERMSPSSTATRTESPSDFRDAADELVRLNPDVIFSFGGEQAPIVKQATATIPIVVVVSNDPVESGLVASLGRPGGNITGVTWVHDQLAGKSVELLKDTLPSVSRVAVLWNPSHTDPEFRETQRAARVLDVQLQSLEVRQTGDYEGAFQAVERGRAEALIVFGSRLLSLNRQRIGDFAAKNRLVMVGVPSWLMEIGGAFDLRAQCARVDPAGRDLRGQDPERRQASRPADAAADQVRPDRQRQARQELGITVPPTVIARADKVIE